MNKRVLSLFTIFLIVSQIVANPVDQATARRVGESFAQNAFAVSTRTGEMNLVQVTDAYYVFNVGTNGFVIVSSDDCFRPIVGYSDEGVFPTENPSPEMVYYLENLSQGRQAALQASLRQESGVAEEWQSLLQGDPLPSRNGNKASFYLVKTKWNQNTPYNKFCPRVEGEGRAYAGCVATAMSQVMNYWKYPTHGYGQHSYTSFQYGELSADFSTANYDFDLMPNSISEQSPVENIDAIALFMYHCGIAVDMSYGTSGSGAYSEDVPEAILKYFGYTNCSRIFYRDNFELGEFHALLRDQFDRGWPCYYSGQDVDGGGGHAFVCDGYDDNDMFHFNWGWSGSGDGFFAIDELDVSSYAFNSDQSVITNFVPAEVFPLTAAAPSAFTAVPNGDLELSVNLSWINPTTSLGGKPIEAIDQIVVMRDNKVIYSVDNPALGEAMTYVDVSGQPITVTYSVYAVCQGVMGRSAIADGINLGPTCLWTVNLSSNAEEGWGEGAVAIVNSSGKTVAELTSDKGETSTQVEIPQGRVTLHWTAPADTVEIGIKILDSDNQQVFAYNGPSYQMPQGIFFETVNTCGGEGALLSPSNLSAEVVDDDVKLNWQGVPNPGYGYVIYRDGLLYDMVSDTTTYTDMGAVQGSHDYRVTAFCFEGESDPSNTVCAVMDDVKAPRNLDVEFLENGKVKITWERPLDDSNLAGYVIYRKALGEDYKRLKLCNANMSSYTDAFSMDDGNYYYYKVVAMHNRAYDESSPARSLRNPDLLYGMANRTHIPSGLTIEEQGEQMLLQWESAFLAETYNVYRNGELIAEDLTETQYACEADGEPSYYQVTGVLNGVESNRSYKAYYASYAVNENVAMEVALFPNPTNNSVTVTAEGLQEVKVFNVTGQLLMSLSADTEEMTLNLSNHPSGVYYFRIATDQGALVRKVVLVK